MKQKKQNKFLYEGLGFPVYLINVQMIEVMGRWTPKINYNKLQKALLLALAHKPFPLTGNEVRFIRKYFEMSMEVFGKKFATTHAAISKWEEKGNQITKMNPTTEICVRLFILENLQVRDTAFRKIYREVVEQTDSFKIQKFDIKPFSFDAEKEELLAM